jgi:deazaflavin-dependent oxidoreductase (nitroreductase family)
VPSSLATRLAAVAGRSTCRLTHHGRRSGTPYDVTIWFAVAGGLVYLSTMNRDRQWTRNVLVRPDVALAVAGERFTGRVTPLATAEERRRAYELLVAKYWVMWLLDRVACAIGRDPRASGLEMGRFAFYRVDLADT